MVIEEINIQTEFRFNGPEYIPSRDNKRLGKQYVAIFNLMHDNKWRTLSEIEADTGYAQASISAQLRHMRKDRFGAHSINRRPRGNRVNGLFEYQLIVNVVSEQQL